MEYKKDINAGFGAHGFPHTTMHVEERKAFYLALSQRTEKTATAIYMVTSHIDDREAIRGSFRDTALALVLETISLEDIFHPAEEVFQSLDLAMTKLMALFNLASALTMVSPSNARILQGELTSIRELCKVGQKYYSLTTLDDVLKTMYPEETAIGQIAPNGQREQPTINMSVVEQKIENKNTALVSPVAIKTNTVAVVHTETVNTDRKDAIVRLIKDKGEVSIKDISKNFGNCSEKTIQRDINALVAEGTLSKTGDRRWSRYSIKK